MWTTRPSVERVLSAYEAKMKRAGDMLPRSFEDRLLVRLEALTAAGEP
jgi:hypothetical protein